MEYTTFSICVYAYCHLYIFLTSCFFQVSYSFLMGYLFLLFNFKSSLYFLWVLFQIRLYKYFFQACDIFSHSLDEQKFLSLMKYSLSIISFTDNAFDIVSKKLSSVTQDHPGFIVCYILEVLYLCVLHLDLWLVLSWYLWIYAVCV